MLSFGYWARMRLVDQALPYVAHSDESAWLRVSVRMIKTGDLNPHRFTKPSLMAYLNTASLSLGILRSGMKGELVKPEDLVVGSPYFTSNVMIRTVRQVYVLLSMAAMTLAALIARHLSSLVRQAERGALDVSTGAQALISSDDAVGLVTLGAILFSAQYLRYSHWYLGVDVIGCFMALGAIAYFLLAPSSTGPKTFALLAGLLTGLCVGTKYNLYPMAVPALLAVSFRHGLKLSLLVLYFVSLVATFLFTTPYALLSIPEFIWAAAGEAAHYEGGHHLHDMQPGLTTFGFYGQSVYRDLGIVGVLIACSGVVVAFYRAPKAALLTLTYPVLLWLYMSKQTAFFARNLLVLSLVGPIFFALGLPRVLQILKALLERRSSKLRRISGGLSLLALTLALASGVRWRALYKAYTGPTDSRNAAMAFIKSRSSKGRLVIAKQLQVAPKTYPAGLQIETYDAERVDVASLKARYPGAWALVPRETKQHQPLPLPNTGVVKKWGGGYRTPPIPRNGEWQLDVLGFGPKLALIKL